MRTAVAALLACAIAELPASAQSLITEVTFSAGRSTEDVNAGSTQIRLFGPVAKSDWRVYLEGTWGDTSSAASDAFGAAYPYDGRVRPMELYLERTAHRGGAILGVRAGRYRLPFGISARSDHAYTGFTRAPLVRYGTNWALSNTFLETGVEILAGSPAVQVAASVGIPQDEGAYRRPRGLDTVVRAQVFSGPLIVGASHVRTQPSEVGKFVHGRMTFSGVDARWMAAGVQLRGEWIFGRPFDGVWTRGGYLDGIVHVERMGPVTGVLRFERLDYFAGEHSDFYRRVTIGARIRTWRAFDVQLSLIRQPRGPEGSRPTAFDAGLTYTARF
ncbi:MAG TPA: hypothetical protein VES67_10370 [Vicinamibacterales bacterium]|nr:hypothetical protein [Vicinamibacterales bacterium]